MLKENKRNGRMEVNKNRTDFLAYLSQLTFIEAKQCRASDHQSALSYLSAAVHVSCLLSVVCAVRWEDRKGWQFLLEAYLSEFTMNDSVELWILTSAYHSDADFQKKIKQFIDSHPAFNSSTIRSTLPVIHLLTSGVANTMMPSLYAAADVFVLPSRGEGWGRPHVEAMSMGLPVIATRWSGPSEYMTEDNSYPLEHEGNNKQSNFFLLTAKSHLRQSNGFSQSYRHLFAPSSVSSYKALI